MRFDEFNAFVAFANVRDVRIFVFFKKADKKVSAFPILPKKRTEEGTTDAGSSARKER